MHLGKAGTYYEKGEQYFAEKNLKILKNLSKTNKVENITDQTVTFFTDGQYGNTNKRK